MLSIAKTKSSVLRKTVPVMASAIISEGMATSAVDSIPRSDLQSFSAHLKSSNRILALLGAGLSASSGLPTFRGAGGLWRSHEATSLATPEAFDADPGLVWRFYSYRKHMALQAQPNKAHIALAELARRKEHFHCLTQNVDGLSQRVDHPSSRLHLLHGSLFNVRCTSFYCDYTEQNNFTDPIVPALSIPTEGAQPTPSKSDKTGAEATSALYSSMRQSNTEAGTMKELDISDDRIQIPHIPLGDLPHCPKCKDGLLRPGVVWFGEPLPNNTITAVENFMNEPKDVNEPSRPKKIDLILVIGTSAKVYPAAGYIHGAKAQGARLAVINMDRADDPGVRDGVDWFFQGDAGEIVPAILRPVIGDI